MKKYLAGLILALMLVGCSDPRLDASSEDAFEASLEKVVADMDDNERQLFTEALMIVMLTGITRDDVAAAQSGNMDELSSPFDHLDGLTAAEVIERAGEIRAAQAR
ncbi:hypothetical protein A167_03364 [Alcanivorax sp. S71-1-4]|jgi:hypothetical protein|uniref:DUF6694 family lipoprotein n=1 Tax=Alcanivorax sp. S71-1-4 TaxID=1177159 RepID=UPI00135A9328|nr:DUF6694 family lipoprotein [Alcanivorax sp. S71-1-4]KAF0805838.1 hypothetical protein A167_03364 [Alcanivorax sp. S71-1-4]